MHEVELKSVVDDLALRRRHVEGAGGRLRFAGTMMDRYYTLDTRPDSGAGRLRVRTYQAPAGGWTELTWKGSARLERGYKVREELNTRVEDETTLREILERTGFAMSEYITREIAWYVFGGASVRLEQFPRMDLLVEVEGAPEAIEHAIQATRISREQFTTEPLKEFLRRFETRTGTKALLEQAAPDVSDSAATRFPRACPLDGVD
ncbi:hypothetical protein HJC22_14510 [Corallococcus exiguus]|uniref:hypothetical protein n=1 Tax=Corallococcus exiguus TaxID=83462 RepID=UPI0014718345|nr:hypothetical protein [Corallococcus exiguus]NNC16933.1 hypothetical protein [Corallococcus exiguus]